MKTLNLALAFAAAALTAGCESGLLNDDSLPRVALGAREAPKSQVYPADQKATYEAARSVVEQMGFKVVKGGPAQGRIVALSDISRGDGGGGARQISMKIELSPGPGSGTELVLSLTEILEAESGGQEGLATQTPLNDTPLYEDFFRKVEKALQAPAKN